MRVESQAPIIGSAFVGGMAQSYLIKKYPEWSWMLSLALIGGGIFLGTKPGWMESIGLGLATSGASGLGTALIPVPGETAGMGRAGIGQRLLTQGVAQRAALMGTARARVGSTVGAKQPEFEKAGLFD